MLPARPHHTPAWRHGSIGRLAFAVLLVGLGTAPAAAAIDLSGNYVGFALVPFNVTLLQTGTALQVTGYVVFNSTQYRLIATGNADPATGAFSVSGQIKGPLGGDPSAPDLCPDFEYSGTGDGEEIPDGMFRSHTCPEGSVVLTKCGNGVIDPLEDCEDGNAVSGDCCSARCRLEEPGSPCTSDENACTADACDASGTCTHVPVTGSCDDGNACTIGDVCVGGVCAPGSAAPPGQSCTGDYDRCTDDVCDAAGTCTHVPASPAACHSAASCHNTCTQELKDCRQTCPGHGRARRDCRAVCAQRSDCTVPGASIRRTLAYVMNECTTDTRGRSSLKQTLFIRRGNCDPVPVVELGPGPPQPDPRGLCRTLGRSRRGDWMRVIGAFQRLAVLPDGSGVVFEVTKRFSLLPGLLSPEAAEGIYFVRADGTAVRKLSEPSRRPLFTPPTGVTGQVTSIGEFFPVSPDGSTIAMLDRGPDTAGEESDQLTVIDVRSGGSRPLTHEFHLEMCCQTFLDDRTVLFHVAAGGTARALGNAYTVGTNGDGNETPFAPPIEIADGKVVAHLGVTGVRPQLLYVGLPAGSEMFLVDQKRVLQLTNFHRPDTFQLGGYIKDGRVFFPASTNLHDENPDELCQVFSIDTLGRRLHQLTHLPSDHQPTQTNCDPETGLQLDRPLDKECGLSLFFVDPITGTVIFKSSCDPLGTNPFGEQLFATRPDGTGLRQLTRARGTTTDPDGTVHVELPGPVAYGSQRSG